MYKLHETNVTIMASSESNWKFENVISDGLNECKIHPPQLQQASATLQA